MISNPSIAQTHRSMGTGLVNRFGLLSLDQKKVRPEAFQEIGNLRKVTASKFLETSRPQMYAKEITVKPTTLKKIKHLVLITDYAFELFNESFEETKKWLLTPNEFLFGDTPFEVCMRGDGESLVQWLRNKLPNYGQIPTITKK